MFVITGTVKFISKVRYHCGVFCNCNFELEMNRNAAARRILVMIAMVVVMLHCAFLDQS